MNLEEQKQQILSGVMYNDLIKELVEAREKAVILTNQYNQSFGQVPEVREKLLKELLHSVGEGAYFEPNFRCEFGFNISVGKQFYANFDCVMLDGEELRLEIMSYLAQESAFILLIMQSMPKNVLLAAVMPKK
jgi:maltose O-acetyltransferase